MIFFQQSFDSYTAEQMVYNAEVMVALCECFFCLSPSNQLWLLERLLDIIKKYVHNRQICCHGGLIGHLLSLLGQHHSGEQQLNNGSTGTNMRDFSLSTVNVMVKQVCVYQMYAHLSDLLCYVHHICSTIFPLILGVKVFHIWMYVCRTFIVYIRKEIIKLSQSNLAD